MRIFFFAMALGCFQMAPAQNADTVSGFINRILPGFKYKQELKYCAFMPGGDFVAGRREGSDSITLGGPVKKKVAPFLLAKFEVRNKDYRKFSLYVRDSILHTLLGHFITTGNTKKIDWNAEIDWKDERLEPMFLPPGDRIYGRKEIDANKIIYKTSAGQSIAVYPDTLVWIRDFAYSYNEPMTKRYFYHPAYGNYPVVGVNQLQAMAYCDWKTRQWNDALSTMNETAYKFVVRLPTGDEWEYAAQAAYPFSVTDSTQTKSYKPAYGNGKVPNNGYKYNFGTYFDETGFVVKSYIHDGFFYTAPCNTYKPDKNGLYNLVGNIAEWTASPGSYQPVYDSTGKNEELAVLRKNFPHSPFNEMNVQEIDTYLEKYVIVKGGAWSTDEFFYLQPGANQYFLPDNTGHSYLGFRMAVQIIRNSK